MLKWYIDGHPTELTIRKHPGMDLRYNLTGRCHHGQRIDLTLTRTTTGRYVLQGSPHAAGLRDEAYWIGKSCEAYVQPQ